MTILEMLDNAYQLLDKPDYYSVEEARGYLAQAKALLEDDPYTEAIQMIMVDYCNVLDNAGVYQEIEQNLQELGI
jgi:hypothetical protein